MMNTREELQKQALETLRTQRRLILNWGTGVGKSRVAVNAMDLIDNAVSGARFLLIVQETAHKDNWIKEFVAALGQKRTAELLPKMTIDCYASLKKHSNTDWDLIVFDEGHHLRSPIRQNILKTMAASRVLVLTATANDKNDGEEMLETLNMTFGEFESMSFGLQDAIDSAVLKEPEIHVIPIVLDHESREKYEDASDYQEKKKTEYFSRKKELGMGYDTPDNEETSALKAKWLNAGARRKRLLGHSKTRVAKKILAGPLKDKRLICFSASVDQIKWLGGTNHVSGKNTPKENKLAIEAFNNGEQRRLFAMGMLQEGQNLKDIEAGLIVQLDGKARPFVQKFGRVMRSETPLLYILYVKNTQDETYLDNALSDIKKEYIKHHEPVNIDGTKALNNILNPDYSGMVKEQRKYIKSWILDQENCVFWDKEDGNRSELSGVVCGLEEKADALVVKLADVYSSTEHLLFIPKKFSFGLIASFMAMLEPSKLPLKILVSKNGEWPTFDVKTTHGKVMWSKKFLEEYKNTSTKSVFISDAVKTINDKIKK